MSESRRFAGSAGSGGSVPWNSSQRQAAAVEALGVAVAARVPVLLWGAPGTGKTSVIRAMATALGWPCETVIASIREPSDFAGLPVVVGEDVRFAPPVWARRLAQAGRGLLFLDELSTAPPAVQAALLRVVLERVVATWNCRPR
jgi:MoxR-like ATPase